MCMAEGKQTGGRGLRNAHRKEAAGKSSTLGLSFGQPARWFCFVDASDLLFCEHQLEESETEPELRTHKRGTLRPAGRLATHQAREYVCEIIPAGMTHIYSRQKGMAPRLAGKDTEVRAKS